MDATIRATCPTCQSSLKIPAKWAGQAVKCKKCGAVVRTKPHDNVPSGPSPFSLDDDGVPSHLPGFEPAEVPNGSVPHQPYQEQPQAPLGSGAFAGMEMPGSSPRGENPFEDEHHPQPVPQPFDPAGYYPPPGYGYPPGYGPPPGYPYPMPPGYGPPPGYPYPMPPGYGPPPGYPMPHPGYPMPGYPYPMPPGMNAPMPGPVQAQPPVQAPMPQGTTAPVPGPIQAQPPVPAPMQLPVQAQLPVPAPMPLPLPPPPPPPLQPQALQPSHRSAPDPIPQSSEFKPSDSQPIAVGRGRYRRQNNSVVSAVLIAACLGLAGLLIFAAISLSGKFKKSGDTSNAGSTEKNTKGGPQVNPPRDPNPGTPQSGSGFPRRLLFVHISQYMYLNPLTHGDKGGQDQIRTSAMHLAHQFRIPTDKNNNQLYVLADTAKEAIFPLKPVINGTFDRFFETSRPQDRLIIYFGGHAIEKDGKAYLVPAEGDLEDMATLIPLEEFYKKFGEANGTQKVVIWDVCRFNPDRGRLRPGSEPMSEKLAELLTTTAPAGVQVVLTAQAKENALEFFNLLPEGTRDRRDYVTGSTFLESVRFVGDKNKLGVKDTDPAGEFPVSAWVEAITARYTKVMEVANKSGISGGPFKQTINVTGGLPENQVAFNAEVPAAGRFDFPPAPMGATGTEIGAIYSEINLPSIVDDEKAEVGAESFIPFPAELLAPYKDDDLTFAMIAGEVEKAKGMRGDAEVQKKFQEFKEKNLFRVNVVESMLSIRDLWGGAGGGPKIEREFSGAASDAVKKTIEAKQAEFPAPATARLNLALAKLDAVAGQRDKQPKRWQANYDYALAQVKARLAYVDEYNGRLGNIRTDVLPELDKDKGQNGYRLVSIEEPKSKTAKALAGESKELFDKMVMDYKGTPWAIQARKDKALSLGLAWQPANLGGTMP